MPCTTRQPVCCAKLRSGPGSPAKEAFADAELPSSLLRTTAGPRRDTPAGSIREGVGAIPIPPPAGGRNEKRRPPLRCACLIQSQLRTARHHAERAEADKPRSARGRFISSPPRPAKCKLAAVGRQAGSASPGNQLFLSLSLGDADTSLPTSC